jgi:hypothetical protein
LKKSNLEKDLQKWLRPNMDMTKAPPEIIAVLYGIYKSTLAKKKAGGVLRHPLPKTGEHNKSTGLSKPGNSNPV